MKVEIEKNGIFQFISTVVLGQIPQNKGKVLSEEMMLENFPELKKARAFRLKIPAKSWVE